MAWFTPSVLETRLSPLELRQLSTGEGRAAAPDPAVLQDALDRAEVEVRGVLSGRAALPDSSPDGLIREMTLDLAVEALMLRKPGEAAKLSEGWVSRIKRSRDLLDRMVEGLIPIPTTTAQRRLVAVDPPSPVDGAFR